MHPIVKGASSVVCVRFSMMAVPSLPILCQHIAMCFFPLSNHTFDGEIRGRGLRETAVYGNHQLPAESRDDVRAIDTQCAQ